MKIKMLSTRSIASQKYGKGVVGVFVASTAPFIFKAAKPYLDKFQKDIMNKIETLSKEEVAKKTNVNKVEVNEKEGRE